jgi:hypothetical protein
MREDQVFAHPGEHASPTEKTQRERTKGEPGPPCRHGYFEKRQKQPPIAKIPPYLPNFPGPQDPREFPSRQPTARFPNDPALYAIYGPLV